MQSTDADMSTRRTDAASLAEVVGDGMENSRRVYAFFVGSNKPCTVNHSPQRLVRCEHFHVKGWGDQPQRKYLAATGP